MTRPDLGLISKWLDPAIVEALDRRRHLKKEWRRYRKLGTLETLWLMLAVSLDTGHRRSQYTMVYFCGRVLQGACAFFPWRRFAGYMANWRRS
jgi:hypothetical protein